MRASRRVVWTVSVIMLAAVSEPISPLPFLPFNNSKDNGAVKHTAATALKGGTLEAQTNWNGKWELFLQNSGVSAMHAILMPLINEVQVYDATTWKISHIKLPPGVPCHVVNATTHSVDCWAHSVQIDVNTGRIRPLSIYTDTWCSSGGLTINGTLVSTGGFYEGGNTARYLAACEKCNWVEYPQALASRRWYSTQATLPDGNFIVIGGRKALSYEYIPTEGQKNRKLYYSWLLKQTKITDEYNLYPFVWLNTDGNLFIFANNRSILLSPKTNKVIKEYPQLPGGARNYPGSGSSALLPIQLYVNNPKVIPAEVLICGGAKHDAYSLAKKKIFGPALHDCARLKLNSAKPRWITEVMPTPRVMSDAVILPTGDILLVNGAKSGCSGWRFARDPAFAPVLYNFRAVRAQRFKELAASNIPRMYHSIAILLPDGKVLVAGSNTNRGYKYNIEFPTELRVEKFSPPYLDPALANLRPKIVNNATPKQIRYGRNFKVKVDLKQNDVSKENLQLTMLAPPFTTHGVSMNMRMLLLGVSGVNAAGAGSFEIQAVAPPNGNVAPPGYYLLYAFYKGVPSYGEWIQIV